MRNSRLIAVLISLALAGPSTAVAEHDDAKIQVMRHYKAGLAHFNLREYAQAITEFEAAYRLRPDPVFLYNLGQAHRFANHPEQALYFYRAYLRTSPDAPNRVEVEGRIATLEKAVAEPSATKTPESPIAQPAQVSSSPANAPVEAVAKTDGSRKTPVYKRWWFWTIGAAVVAGAAVGVGVGIGTQHGASFNANVGTYGPGALTVVRF